MSNKDENRPLSPHLQIYAWNISSLSSIMHRLTGVALYLSIVAISWYVVLFTYKTGAGVAVEECDCAVMEILGYVVCLAGVAVVFGLCYHFINGIRHLFWDIGKGFELETARVTGILTFVLAFLMTFAIIAMIAYFKYM